jgi:mercuric ion binding protein
VATLSVATPALAQAKVVTETAVFAVENMYCELCPLTVKTAMERVSGVASVVVDFDAKTATVTFDPAVATREAIAAASSGVGYPAHLAGGA